MSMDIQAEIDARIRRWTDFLQPDARPGFLFMVQVPSNHPAPPPSYIPWRESINARVESKWERYLEARRRAGSIRDDTVPFINMLTSTEVFAEALGCDVHRAEGISPFALPRIRSASEVASVKVPDIGSSTLAPLLDMADELHRRAGPDAVFRLVDIQSPMDIAALVWEKESLFMAMFETPEAVKELAWKAHELLVAFMDEWFRRYGTSFVAHYPEYYMPHGITLSEDEIGNVSPEMFDEFFFPHLAALSERYDGIGIHCCADAEHQWGGLAKVPGLRILNLCKPPIRDEGYIHRAHEFFGSSICQMHFGWTPRGDIAERPGQYPSGQRHVIYVNAKTEADAVKACDALNAARERTAVAIL